MSGKRSSNQTLADYARWWKQGRGRGEGAAWQPWLKVRDVGSDGLSKRMSLGEGKPESHALSKMESSIQLAFHHLKIPFQEQKPIYPLADVMALSKALGIRYPRLGNGTPAVLTYDFFLPEPSLFFPNGPGAIQAKVDEELEDLSGRVRLFEKLELYRRFAAMQGWGMLLMDEMVISERSRKTLSLLREAETLPKELGPSVVELALRAIRGTQNPALTLGEMSEVVACATDSTPEHGLVLVKHILWHRMLPFAFDADLEKHLPIAGLFLVGSPKDGARRAA